MRPKGERNNCFSKIQLVGQIYRDKTTLASKTQFSGHPIVFVFKAGRFRYKWAITHSLVVAQPIGMQH